MTGDAAPVSGGLATRARLAVLTPEGRGAIAAVRVWGPGALGVVEAAFRPATGRRLAATPPGVPRFGRIGAGQGDEVVAVVIPGEPPEVEVYGHGGHAAVEMVVKALIAEGAERRQPVAWVRHDATTAIEAEARVDLARAPTLRVAEVLLEQAGGALGREVARIATDAGTRPAEAGEAIDRLLARSAVGLRLTGGWSVVLAGRPNVGKSALVNALAGYDRAIVAPTPGMMRDVVSVRTAFDGWPVELSDTAGLRESADATEAAGVSLARVREASADLTLLVLDGSEPLTESDHDLIRERPDALVVASKADLARAWEARPVASLSVSALSGHGLEDLAAAVARRLVPDPPAPGAAVPFRPGHVRKLRAALDALKAGDGVRAVSLLEAIFVLGGTAVADPFHAYQRRKH